MRLSNNHKIDCRPIVEANSVCVCVFFCPQYSFMYEQRNLLVFFRPYTRARRFSF